MATSHTYFCTECTSRAAFYCECTHPSTTLCATHISVHSMERGDHEPKRIYIQCTKEEQKAADTCIDLITNIISQKVNRIIGERNRMTQKLLGEMRSIDLDYIEQVENTTRKLKGIQEELEGIKTGLGVDIYCPSAFGECWMQAKEKSREVKTN